jgi:hypothetical protein
MEGAFGFDETKFMDAEDTVDYFISELGFEEDDAEDRAAEMGKDPKLDKTSKYRKKPNFTMKGRIVEKKAFTKEDIIKMSEDLVIKKSEDGEISKKDGVGSPILRRNVRSLKNLAEFEGVGISQLIKMLKNE